MYNTRMRKCLKLIFGTMGKLRHSWGKGEPKTQPSYCKKAPLNWKAPSYHKLYIVTVIGHGVLSFYLITVTLYSFLHMVIQKLSYCGRIAGLQLSSLLFALVCFTLHKVLPQPPSPEA